MTEDFYGAEVKSFTKGTVSVARVSKQYLNPEDRVLIIDDFLAHGEAAMGLCSLVEQAGATSDGMDIRNITLTIQGKEGTKPTVTFAKEGIHAVNSQITFKD